ncbi:MAG: hypothetical protein KAV87_31945, partial [Desulfobacteraceae bacterium]|nr:hypothetical protein [Desulfobacteraceae bacterium]
STSSGIKRDLYDERMSTGLFKDFIKRIESREIPPEPFISKAWNGGLPYVGIAHYLDLDGDGIAGKAEKTWVDGTHLKMRGTFEDNELGNAAYESVQRDIENKVPPEERVRVSMTFIDWGHEHERIGQFVRKSLMDRCSFCEQGLGEKIYRKGHLVHLALTRQPAYPEADIQLEVKSMSQRKADAASIVGDELAEDLEKKSDTLTARSADIDPNAVVIRQDGEDGDGKEEDVEKKEKDKEKDEMVYESLSGAKSLDEADSFLTSRSKDVPLLDSWAIFASVLANIAGDEQREVVFQTVSEFQERLDIMALRALMKVSDMIEKAEAEVAEEETADAPESTDGGTETVEEKSTISKTDEHPLDEALTGLKDSFDAVMAETLPEAERLAALQEPVNKLADVIKRSVSGDPPVEQSDILNSEVVKAAFVEAVAPLQAEIAALRAENASASDVKPAKPVRRAIQVGGSTTVAARKPSKFPSLRSIVRRSVGLEE